MAFSRRNILAAGAAGAVGAVSFGAGRVTAAPLTTSVLDVYDFGARGDGSDDRAAIQRAINEAQASGGPAPLVRLGGRHGLSGELRIDRGIAISGGGSRSTLLHPTNGYHGWLCTVVDAGRNGQWQAGDTTYMPQYDLSGAELSNLHFNGLDRNKLSKGLRVLRADDLLLDNVTFGFFSGTALQLGAGPGDGVSGGSVRESDLRRVKVYKSGNGPAVPGAVFQSSPTGSTDGTNQVYASQFRYVYNHGGLVFRNDNPQQKVRRIQIDQMQLHGLTHSSVGNVVDHDLLTFEGGLIEISLTNVLANGSGAGRAVFRSKSSAGGRPVGVTVDVRASGCAGDVFVADSLGQLDLSLYAAGGLGGDWVRIEDAALSAYQVRLSGPIGYDAGKVKHPGRGTVTWQGKSV
jgi:hypothetical protein